MIADITRAERYLFVSEEILPLPLLVYKACQAFAGVVFCIYVLLKQNWPHLALILLTLAVWPFGLKQWNTSKVSLQITVYIFQFREDPIVNSPFSHQSVSAFVSLSASKVHLTILSSPPLSLPHFSACLSAEIIPGDLRTAIMIHLS